MTHTDRHPRSANYDTSWVASLDMGPHPLWQLESLLEDVPITAGMEVLDLGCGKGASSVFLARETGARVTACDLWVSQDELRGHLDAAGVGDRVRAVKADARALPFDDAAFDVIVSVDAFEYFGTDVRALPDIVRVLRPGGRLGMSTPALQVDPYDEVPPAHVTEVVGGEAAAWHTPEWWARHWELSGLVRDIRARMQSSGREDWLTWCNLLDEGAGPVAQMLRRDTEELIGFALVSATRI